MKTHNLFISHSWTYSDQYNRLVKLLDERSYFRYKNYSVPKNNPVHNANSDKELKAAIKNQMSSCGVILILAGVYSSYSKWIDIEIDLAKEGFSSCKPILAIQPWGSERTSKKVKDAADRIVKWNTESVVGAIRDLD